LMAIAFLCFSFPVFTQNLFPDNNFLYSDESVARIDITINPDYLQIITEGDLSSDIEYPANFKMTRGSDVKMSDNVGFRLRGNTSRKSMKKSFKVSFNSFAPGQSFEGVEKINLNGEHNDPSLSRAKICWDLFRDAGIPAPRANHVEFYINGEYRGLYLNVEHIDENFVKLRFGNNDGNLYKCLWPADLNYLGSDPELYKYVQGSRRAYELTRNEELHDYSDLAEFIDVLNNSPISDFPISLEPLFNINTYLKNLVVEILTGHWDAYSFNKNNFYLYHNESTGKFEFIPYDPDNTFGIDWFGIDWATRDIFQWDHPTEKRPLYARILDHPVYHDRFTFYADRFLKNYFSAGIMDPKLDSLRSMIAPYAARDIYRALDYNYTYDDFYNSMEEAAGKHVKYGIKPFISVRNLSAFEQLDNVNIAPIISQVQAGSQLPDQDIYISALVEDEEIPAEVMLFYDTGRGYTGMQMQTASGESYNAIISDLSGTGLLKYYITATDIISQFTREPVQGEFTLQMAVSMPEYFTVRNGIQIYPNPFNTFLDITISGDYKRLVYKIMDISGETITSGELMQSGQRISVNPGLFHPGVYIIRFDGLNHQGKVISREHRRLIYYE